MRTCFSQERTRHLPATETMDSQAKVIYTAKDGHSSQSFSALDWLAQPVTPMPKKGEKMVCYYGYCSNKSRGMCIKVAADAIMPALVDSHQSSKAWRKNWARLIQYIYQVEPLKCSKGLVRWGSWPLLQQ